MCVSNSFIKRSPWWSYNIYRKIRWITSFEKSINNNEQRWHEFAWQFRKCMSYNGKNRWFLISQSICCTDSLISQWVLGNCFVGTGCWRRIDTGGAQSSGDIERARRQRTQLVANWHNGTLDTDNTAASASLVVLAEWSTGVLNHLHSSDIRRWQHSV